MRKSLVISFLILSLLGCESAEHKAQRIEAERQAQARVQAQNAEAERARQAAEAARKLREELGDEIDAQVTHWTMGGEMPLVGRTPAGPVNHQFDEEIARGLFRITNLKMFIKRSTGVLTIMFDCQFHRETGLLGSYFMVRLFDENGQYITHFRTEMFVFPEVTGNGSPKLKAEHNAFQYRISRRDADYIQKAEFGIQM